MNLISLKRGLQICLVKDYVNATMAYGLLILVLAFPLHSFSFVKRAQ